MKEKLDSRDAALKKYAIIAPLLRPDLESAEKRRIRNEILSKENISDRTLRRYIAQYTKLGFDGLMPKERNDKGVSQAIPKQILEEAVTLKKELPERSVRRIIKILETEGSIAKGSVARSTLSRQLIKLGFGSLEIKRTASQVKATRRFVKEHRNTLWQADLKYGPYIPNPEKPGKRLRTYMIAFIDDATRFVTHAEFYTNQKLPILEDCFRKAIIKCGIPTSIYVDNGKIFISKWFRIACARLNIRHLHTAPYSPESKGKIERFNRTVEEFFSEVELQSPQCLDELNQWFKVWIDEGYNHSEHSSLHKKTPADVFMTDSKTIRFATPEECRDCFLWEETRKVDKTGCVQLQGTIYEAGIEFVGKKIDLRYDPFNMEIIEVWFNGEKRKTVSPLQIGEFCMKPKAVKEKETVISSSRFLNALADESKHKMKSKLGAIAFRDSKDGEGNV